MTTTLPVIVRPPKNVRTDLTAVDDRRGQLTVLIRQQRRTVFLGWMILVVFFGVLGGWAAFMPLSGAVTANGTLVVEGRNKPVQHYGGGIVADILVSNGDLVQKGDVLVRLDPTDTQASMQVSDARLMAMLAEEARLLAERDGLDRVTFPDTLTDAARTSPEYTAFMDAQVNAFEARRTALTGQLSILSERVDQSREEIQGLKAQIVSIDRQLELIKDELSSVQYLFNEGLAPKRRLLALQRQEADLVGRKGRLESTVARIEQNINETRLRIENLQDTEYAKVVDSLKSVRSELKELEEHHTVASARAERTDVRAPSAGVVQGLTVSSVGQVVGNGQILMEIVPQDQPLQVSVDIKPSDIEQVEVGQPAKVQLTIYNFRKFSKKINGFVDFIAPDISEPENAIEFHRHPGGYYEASITLDQDDVALYRQSDNIELFAGAPVLVIIPTVDRTLLEYLLDPIAVGLEQAFREP